MTLFYQCHSCDNRKTCPQTPESCNPSQGSERDPAEMVRAEAIRQVQEELRGLRIELTARICEIADELDGYYKAGDSFRSERIVAAQLRTSIIMERRTQVRIALQLLRELAVQETGEGEKQ